MASSKHGEVEVAIHAALFGNLVIAILKLASAIQSGSSGMLAETAHSFADAGNQGMLRPKWRNLTGLPLTAFLIAGWPSRARAVGM